MRILLATGGLLTCVSLAACSSSGSGHGASPNAGRLPVPPHTSAQPQATLPSGPLLTSGNFCTDVRALTIKAAEIGRSLTTYSPAQVEQAVKVDEQLESTAAAEAPASLRADIALASNGPQFSALAAAGYDIHKVDPAKLHPTPVQDAARSRLRQYVISTCGFDPDNLGTGAP